MSAVDAADRATRQLVAERIRVVEREGMDMRGHRCGEDKTA